jgi:hypothetical protein
MPSLRFVTKVRCGVFPPEVNLDDLADEFFNLGQGGVRGLEAMFPEHWERGTGTWNVERHFVKSWYEGGIPIS